MATQLVDRPEWRLPDYLATTTGSITRLELEVEGGLLHQLRFDGVEAHLVAVSEPSITALACIGSVIVWWRRFRGEGKAPRWT